MLFVTKGQVVNLDLIETSVGDGEPNVRQRKESAHASGRKQKPKLEFSKAGKSASRKSASTKDTKGRQAPPADPEKKQQRTLWD